MPEAPQRRDVISSILNDYASGYDDEKMVSPFALTPITLNVPRTDKPLPSPAVNRDKALPDRPPQALSTGLPLRVGIGGGLPRSPRITSQDKKEQPLPAPTTISVGRSIERNGKPPSLTLKVTNGSTAGTTNINPPSSTADAPTSARAPALSEKVLPARPALERPLPGIPPPPPEKSVLRSQVRDMDNKNSKPTLNRDSGSSAQQLSPPEKSVMRKIVPASGSRPTLADTMSRGRKPKPFEPAEQEIIIKREISAERMPLKPAPSKPIPVEPPAEIIIRRETSPDRPPREPAVRRPAAPQPVPQIQYVPDTPPASDSQSFREPVDIPFILRAGTPQPQRKDSLPIAPSATSSEGSAASAPLSRITKPVLPSASPVPDDSPSKYGLTGAYVDTPSVPENSGMKILGQPRRRKSSTGFELFKTDSNTSLPESTPSGLNGLQQAHAYLQMMTPSPSPVTLEFSHPQLLASRTQPNSSDTTFQTRRGSNDSAGSGSTPKTAIELPPVRYPASPNSLRPPGTNAPYISMTHVNCYWHHKRFHTSRTLQYSVACMLCYNEDEKEWWTCGWCALRICGGCRSALEGCPKRSILARLEQIEDEFRREHVLAPEGIPTNASGSCCELSSGMDRYRKMVKSVSSKLTLDPETQGFGYQLDNFLLSAS